MLPGMGFLAGNATPASRTSNIASGIRTPGWQSGALSNGTNTTTNMRSAHINESGAAVTGVKVIYSGWYSSTTTETSAPNALTVTAAIEYPSGTMTQVTWGAATSTTVAIDANLVSDNCVVAIPAGAQFWVRTFTTVTAGQTWATVGTGSGAGTCEVGVGLTDKSMAGTIAGTASGFGPSAVIATSNAFSKLSMAGVGDSIMAGAVDGNYSSRSNTGMFQRGSDNKCPLILCAVTGTGTASQAANFTRRADLFTKAGITHIVCDWAVNDINAGMSLATLQTNLQAIWAAMAATGAKVIHSTTTPKTTSTDFWLTTANQTAAPAGFVGGATSVRAQLNNWIRTLPSFTGGPLYDYVEMADAIEGGRDLGVFRAGADTHTTGFKLTGTDAGGSTTTVVQTGLTLTASRYAFGAVVFTSGANSGLKRTISSHTTGGALTLSSALTSTPTAGDAFYIYSITDTNTGDGLHPAVTGTGSPFYGGIYYGADAMAAKLTTLLTTG